MHEITKVEPLEKYQLRVTFEDCVEGVIDVSELTNLEGVFAPLRDPVKFREVRVHHELGTVYWPNGADLDPDGLYALVTGEPIDIQTPAGTS